MPTLRQMAMKEIHLTMGAVAIVDDDIYQWLMRFKWHLKKGVSEPLGYAANSISIKGKVHTIFMHYFILPRIRGYDTDHINRNSLDNRRINLRYATRSENYHNQRKDGKINRPDCRRGHLLVVGSSGKRVCRICMQASSRKSYLRRKYANQKEK